MTDHAIEQRLKTLAAVDSETAARMRLFMENSAPLDLADNECDVNAKEKIAAWLAEESPDVIIIPGIGEGSEVACLLEDLPDNASVLLVEDDAGRLLRLFADYPLERLAGEERLCIATGVADAIEAAIEPLLNLPRNPVLRIFDVVRVEPERSEVYAAALLDIRNRLRVKILNLGTLMYLGPKWQYNTLKNFPVIVRQPSALRLDGLLKGKPIIVAAAGPSLTDALPYLVEHRSRFALLAVGTALAPLRKAGLRPDLVMSVDASRNTARQFTVECGDLYLVSSMIAYPPVVRKFKGVFVARGSANYAGQWAESFLGQTCLLDAGGTVSSTALDLAVRMGCAPIITVGLDLCLTADGYTHAAHSMYHGEKAGQQDCDRLLRVAGNYRETVYTRQDFRSYIDTIADLVRRHASSRFINANNDGARIKGMELIGHERIGEFGAPPFDAYAVVEEAYRDVQLPDLDRVLTAFADAAENLTQAAAKAREAAMLCNRLVAMLRLPGRESESEAQVCLDELSAIDRYLLAARDSSMLTDMCLRRVYYAMDVQKSVQEERCGEGVQANRRSRRLYEAVARAAMLTRDILLESAAAIESGGDTEMVDFENSAAEFGLLSM